MAKTKIFQCPNCGALHPTKKETGYLKCDCGTKGEIRRHLVKTPQVIKHDPDEVTTTKQANKAGKVYDPPQVGTISSPTMPGQPPRFKIESQKKGDAMPDKKSKDEGEEDYGCAQCKAPVKKGQKYCPNCGAALDWGKVD